MQLYVGTSFTSTVYISYKDYIMPEPLIEPLSLCPSGCSTDQMQTHSQAWHALNRKEQVKQKTKASQRSFLLPTTAIHSLQVTSDGLSTPVNPRQPFLFPNLCEYLSAASQAPPRDLVPPLQTIQWLCHAYEEVTGENWMSNPPTSSTALHEEALSESAGNQGGRSRGECAVAANNTTFISSLLPHHRWAVEQ